MDKQRVALVTGASRGIGRAIALQLAADGLAVVVNYARNQQAAEQVVGSIAGAGGHAIAVQADVASSRDRESLVKVAIRQWGRIDVLVNNAGITCVIPAQDEPLETFAQVLATNLTGAFLCSQRFGRAMLAAGKGTIVNVASVLGIVGSGQVPQASYAASKGGLVNLTRELAAQWARKGIRVNALAPAWFPSEMTQDMFGDERSLAWIRGRTPMGRAGDPQELVGPLLFLASDAASYVTGQVLAVDGGWTIV
jgi:NAD(P)-dependent dehydrogenase (short-subunit alcohol dehydrogenase family)